MILTVAEANFLNTPFHPLGYAIPNFHSDFTSQWYEDVGKHLVSTLFIASFVPYVTFASDYCTLFVSRYFDGYSFDKTNAKCVQTYIMLYSGPEVTL